MPGSLCCVPQCAVRGGHRFPKDDQLRKKWFIAVCRDKWRPGPHSVVCSAHFKSSDFLAETYKGTKPLVKRLRQGAVPSIFNWTKVPSACQLSRRARAEGRRQRGGDQNDLCDEPEELETVPGNEVEVETSNPQEERPLPMDEMPGFVDTSCQTDNSPAFSIDRIKHDSKRMTHYTGIESYEKFLLILFSLGPAVNHLNYYYHGIRKLSVENQLLLTLIKLRLNWTNFVLADLFEISECSVISVFVTWINFLYHQWKEIDIWPARDLVRFFAPSDFYRKFPHTRVIMDGTECPVQKPNSPLSQQATFSTYKNRNTVKVLVGCSPGGLISYVSECYGGSASDRQIVERSGLMNICDPGDSIMADKGFTVQDIFAPYDVAINHPAFFSKKNRLDGKTVQSGRVISSKRVHIERIIGLLKTYKILKHPLTSRETNLSSEILFVCSMLANFKDGIVSSTA